MTTVSTWERLTFLGCLEFGLCRWNGKASNSTGDWMPAQCIHQVKPALLPRPCSSVRRRQRLDKASEVLEICNPWQCVWFINSLQGLSQSPTSLQISAQNAGESPFSSRSTLCSIYRAPALAQGGESEWLSGYGYSTFPRCDRTSGNVVHIERQKSTAWLHHRMDIYAAVSRCRPPLIRGYTGSPMFEPTRMSNKRKRTLLKMLSLNKYIHQNPEIYWALCPQLFCGRKSVEERKRWRFEIPQRV
jgi:hypothetical protein